MIISLCGDIVPTLTTVPAFDAGDIPALMGGAEAILRASDFSIANLECALTDYDRPIRKCGPNLGGKPEYARVLADCGLTHLSMSNNHVMDFGERGMRDTVSAVESAGMVPFGFGENSQMSREPVFFQKDGVRVALIGVCEHEYSYALTDRYGANPFDPFDTMEDIAKARQQADFVVVLYHGGKEQCEYPSPRLRRACRAMVRAGADLIACQHSHCIGCRERYQNAEILYGQGNFNFVKYPDHPHWQSGLMLRLTLMAGKPIECEYLPVVTTDTGITLAGSEQAAAILAAFEQRSETMKSDAACDAAWNAFCESVREQYVSAAAHAFEDIPEGELSQQIFPHYLDCEAHTDVWQTIFKTWHGNKTAEI